MPREKRKTLLLHPLRREIYKIVSEFPGSYFFEIASALDLPHGTVSWHLKKLEKAGLVSTIKYGGRRIYFSKALRTPEIERAFVVLRSKATQQVFEYILNNPGCYQVQIAEKLKLHHDTVRHHVKRLKDVGLIDMVKEGRTVRYFIGEVGKKIIEGNTEIISRAYIEYLFSRLEEECFHPEIVELEMNKVTIRVSCPGKEDAYLSIELKGWEFIKEKTIEEEEKNEPKVTPINEKQGKESAEETL